MSQIKVSAAESNKAFFGLVQGGEIKQAADMLTSFTRIRIRESSFAEKILPGVVISNADLTPQLTTDKNVKLVERENGIPGSVTIPYGTQPIQYYFTGDRYPVFFDRIASPKFTKDVSELRTYGMDIRQVISDNALLDMDAELDRKFLAACQSIVGAEGSTVFETGSVQNRVIVDPLGVTRSSLVELTKILPSTPAALEAVTILVNNITIRDIAKFGRDQGGGDISEDMFVNGFTQKKLFGVNWVVTNKLTLVPNNVFWMYASPEFIGKSFILEDVTMFVEKRAFMLEFFAYCERGATIGNPASVARGRISTT